METLVQQHLKPLLHQRLVKFTSIDDLEEMIECLSSEDFDPVKLSPSFVRILARWALRQVKPEQYPIEISQINTREILVSKILDLTAQSLLRIILSDKTPSNQDSISSIKKSLTGFDNTALKEFIRQSLSFSSLDELEEIVVSLKYQSFSESMPTLAMVFQGYLCKHNDPLVEDLIKRELKHPIARKLMAEKAFEMVWAKLQDNSLIGIFFNDSADIDASFEKWLGNFMPKFPLHREESTGDQPLITSFEESTEAQPMFVSFE